jgi:hypothetical protein
MAALLHFCFELIKIGILSSAYALILLLIAVLIKKISPTGSERALKNKLKFWKKAQRVIFLLLFIFMFTYWGNHGLGDDSYLPVGHFQTVYQSDEFDYLEDKHDTQLNISNFTYDANNLYAEAGRDMFGKVAGDYLVWNLKNNIWKFYSKDQYLNSKYPLPITFLSFNDQYNNYWSGWRFWLLP